jgi:hypothetical protein
LTSLNDEQPERLLLHLHTGLPLLPAADDGSRSAVLARFGAYEVGLTEFPPDHMPILPLWVELFGCHSGRKLLDGRGFSEIADAVDAVPELRMPRTKEAIAQQVELSAWAKLFDTRDQIEGKAILDELA